MTSAKHTALGFKAVLKWSLTRSCELSGPTVNLREPPRHTLWVLKYYTQKGTTHNLNSDHSAPDCPKNHSSACRNSLKPLKGTWTVWSINNHKSYLDDDVTANGLDSEKRPENLLIGLEPSKYVKTSVVQHFTLSWDTVSRLKSRVLLPGLVNHLRRDEEGKKPALPALKIDQLQWVCLPEVSMVIFIWSCGFTMYK